MGWNRFVEKAVSPSCPSTRHPVPRVCGRLPCSGQRSVMRLVATRVPCTQQNVLILLPSPDPSPEVCFRHTGIFILYLVLFVFHFRDPPVVSTWLFFSWFSLPSLEESQEQVCL